MVFEKYANYYDTLYAEKQYDEEVDFVLGLLKDQGSVNTMLDMGCGTGGHALPLAKRGVQVSGFDISAHMLETAKQKAAREQMEIEYHLGDIRNFRTGRKFDAVISMFAVMGYQTSNDDFFHAMQTARAHLESGGTFIFDAWFGPAVLSERPEERVKELQAGGQRIIRIAHPELDVLKNTVMVNYTIFRLQGDRVIDETRESHAMRYLFDAEVRFFAQQAGFDVVKVCPFMETNRQPNEKDWNVTWVLKAV